MNRQQLEPSSSAKSTDSVPGKDDRKARSDADPAPTGHADTSAESGRASAAAPVASLTALASVHAGGEDERSPNEAASKQRKQRKKKAPDAPRRPLCAYNLFFREERARLLAERRQQGYGTSAASPDEDLFATMGKTIAKLWNELSPSKRKKYQEQAAEEKERYNAAKAEYEERTRSSKVEAKHDGKQRLSATRSRDKAALKPPPKTAKEPPNKYDESHSLSSRQASETTTGSNWSLSDFSGTQLSMVVGPSVVNDLRSTNHFLDNPPEQSDFKQIIVTGPLGGSHDHYRSIGVPAVNQDLQRALLLRLQQQQIRQHQEARLAAMLLEQQQYQEQHQLQHQMFLLSGTSEARTPRASADYFLLQHLARSAALHPFLEPQLLPQNHLGTGPSCQQPLASRPQIQANLIPSPIYDAMPRQTAERQQQQRHHHLQPQYSGPFSRSQSQQQEQSILADLIRRYASSRASETSAQIVERNQHESSGVFATANEDASDAEGNNDGS